jgi:hypothetical protein
LPAGAVFDPLTGTFSWRPTETQGPGRYVVTFTATDDGSPPLSASQAVKITVNEVDKAPVVALKRPVDGSSFVAPAEVVIEAEARDVDGAVRRVEFFAGSTKPGEHAAAPLQLHLDGGTCGPLRAERPRGG